MNACETNSYEIALNPQTSAHCAHSRNSFSDRAGKDPAMAVTISWTNWKTLRQEYCSAGFSATGGAGDAGDAGGASSTTVSSSPSATSSPSAASSSAASGALGGSAAAGASGAGASSNLRTLRASWSARKTSGTSVKRMRPRPPWPKWRRATPKIRNCSSVEPCRIKCASRATKSCSASRSACGSCASAASSESLSRGPIMAKSFSTAAKESSALPASRTARATASATSCRRRQGKYAKSCPNKASSKSWPWPTAAVSGADKIRSSCSASPSSSGKRPDSDLLACARTAAHVAKQWFT
mmetsp:Transcript_22770/g.76990  ORF Transcript_22770/g.76990 Transcript_22770/m.76990 type:complete len:298 (-) Transcript_22770:1203-2096(-)